MNYWEAIGVPLNFNYFLLIKRVIRPQLSRRIMWTTGNLNGKMALKP